MIRDAHARSLIFDVEIAIQALVERDWRSRNGHIGRHYRNLIRYWAIV